MCRGLLLLRLGFNFVIAGEDRMHETIHCPLNCFLISSIKILFFLILATFFAKEYCHDDHFLSFFGVITPFLKQQKTISKNGNCLLFSKRRKALMSDIFFILF